MDPNDEYPNVKTPTENIKEPGSSIRVVAIVIGFQAVLGGAITLPNALEAGGNIILVIAVIAELLVRLTSAYGYWNAKKWAAILYFALVASGIIINAIAYGFLGGLTSLCSLAGVINILVVISMISQWRKGTLE